MDISGSETIPAPVDAVWRALNDPEILKQCIPGCEALDWTSDTTLAATLVIVPDIPIASLGLLLGVDRFMSQCRAATNFIGNGIVTLAVARWENELNRRNLDARAMSNPEPEAVM